MRSTIISVTSGLLVGTALAFALRKPKPKKVTTSKFSIPRPSFQDSNSYKLVIGINMEIKTTQKEVCSILGDAVIKAVTQAINTNSDPYLLRRL